MMHNPHAAFALAERRHPWLRLLREAYAIIDASVEKTIQEHAPPACLAGCAACCLQPIPLTPLEALGLKLFLRELATDGERARFSAMRNARRADERKALNLCPFLDKEAGRCLPYALRPIACRRFLVKGLPCAKGENPTDSRPHDVIEPDRRELVAALRHTAPFYKNMAALPQNPGFEDFAAISTVIQLLEW